ASPRKKKKPTGGLTSQQSAVGGDNSTVKAVSAPNPFIPTDQFQQSLHPPFLQASAPAPQPPHIFAMQPATHFQAPAPSQTHPQPHQMFVSANGQLMTATPMVSIAVPAASTQQAALAASATPTPGTTAAACYGSPFQPFLMGQSAPGQPAGQTVAPAATPAAAYPQQLYLASAPGGCGIDLALILNFDK
ncbi:hypothetical protein TSMEX_008549, partial [Taenia solium]